MNTKQDICKKAILAGILIGFGVIINLKSDDRIIGALLFTPATKAIAAVSVEHYFLVLVCSQ